MSKVLTYKRLVRLMQGNRIYLYKNILLFIIIDNSEL